MDKQTLASYLDLANHHPDSTVREIESLCQAVFKHGFNSAFVNPRYVAYAKNYARSNLGKELKVGTVVSFPIGQDTLKTKIEAVRDVAHNGADEIDVSADVGLLKAGRFDNYLAELINLVETAKDREKPAVIKFIIETGFLTDAEIKKASELVLQSGADFVKTCSG